VSSPSGREEALAAARKAPLILASASPRRREILQLAGLDFEVVVADADARPRPAGSPARYAAEGARLKALAVAREHPGRLVVGADTVVALGRGLLGKPADEEQAREMLALLSGRRHSVYTALAIALGPPAEIVAEACEESRVTFRKLSSDDINTYVASGDALDKAGAYGIQSGGGRLVAEVIGSYLNVVGLPLGRLRDLLSRLNWNRRSQ